MATTGPDGIPAGPALIREIEEGLPIHAWYAVEPDRAHAILDALSQSKPGDVLLIAGKGHEATQVFGSDARPFDDKEMARRAWNRITGETVTIAHETAPALPGRVA